MRLEGNQEPSPEQRGPEQREKWTREAREDLTNNFTDRTRFLPEAINKLAKQAVIDGNFRELHTIVRQLDADVKRLEEGYQQHWKDLGPDKK